MRTTIFYFSSTGNSLKVARDIAQGLGDTEVVNIAKAIKGDINVSADRIGIVFPVYMWGLPSMVVDFIKKLKGCQSKYFFAVATYGGMFGKTFQQLEKLLNAQGLILSASFGIKMPGNYTPLYGAIPDAKQKAMFENEKNKVVEIINSLKENKNEKVKGSIFFVDWVLSDLFYNMGMPKVHNLDRQFWVENTCTKCGICRKVCLADNIKLEDGKPVWQHKCEHCLACLQWCPVNAIQYGKSTFGRKRYHHPDLKVNDFFME